MASTTVIPKIIKVHPRFICDEKGRRKEAVISYSEYKEIKSLIEDYYDGICIEQRKGDKGIPLEEVEGELKADGIL